MLWNKMDQKTERKPNIDDKVHIVNTLIGINGWMKEFSQDLEMRLNRAFKSKSGRKYGMSKAQMQSYSKNLAFSKGDYDAVAKDAKQFLNQARKEL